MITQKIHGERYNIKKTLCYTMASPSYKGIVVGTEASEIVVLDFADLRMEDFFVLGLYSWYDILDSGTPLKYLSHILNHIRGYVMIESVPTCSIGDFRIVEIGGWTSGSFKFNYNTYYDLVSQPIYVPGKKLKVTHDVIVHDYTPVGTLRWYMSYFVTIGYEA
jgi:hypothetical protein